MRLILNVLWLLLAGVELALTYAAVGLVLCFTIIGIPFGVQLFKLAGFALWPFGRASVPDPTAGAFSSAGNIVWVIFVGWWLALAHLVLGLLLCLTIIGIPLGVAVFKMTPLAFTPFGRRVVTLDTGPVPPGSYTVTVRSG